IVGLTTNVRAEEFQNALHLAARDNWKAEGTMEAHNRGRQSAGEIRVLRDVGNPCRSPARPNAAGQTDPRRERGCPCRLFKFRRLCPWRMPRVDTTYDLSHSVDAPEASMFAVECYTNCAKDLRHRP